MKPKDPEKIELIYKATLQLVNTNGLTGLNMAAIGKASGLGMGTIYVYFKSKEELINSLFKRLKELNTRRIYEVMDDGMPFIPTLKRLHAHYIENRIDYFEEHVFIEQCSVSHFLDEEAKLLDEAAFIGINALLDRGKSEHLVKEMDNELLTAHMIGAANAIVQQVVMQRLTLSPALLDQAFTLCWDGIKR